MGVGNVGRGAEVGDGAGDFDEAEVGAGGEGVLVDGLFEEEVGGRLQVGEFFEVGDFHIGVGVNMGERMEAVGLNLAGGGDPGANYGRSVSGKR